MHNRLMARFRRHIIQTNLIVLGAEGILACLLWFSGEWFFSGSKETFGPLNNYVFIWLSILVATIAALNAVLASTIASDSQRPFVNVNRIHVNWSRNDSSPIAVENFLIGINNAGVFPADQVSIFFNVCGSDGDKEKQHLFKMHEENAAIYFPNEDMPNLMFVEADTKDKLTVQSGGKLQVKIIISYENKLTQKTHKTVRNYLAEYNPEAQQCPIPITEEDYWD